MENIFIKKLLNELNNKIIVKNDKNEIEFIKINDFENYKKYENIKIENENEILNNKNYCPMSDAIIIDVFEYNDEYELLNDINELFEIIKNNNSFEYILSYYNDEYDEKLNYISLITINNYIFD